MKTDLHSRKKIKKKKFLKIFSLIFRFETQSSLEAYISHECLPVGHSEYIHIEDITWTCEHTKFIFECHV